MRFLLAGICICVLSACDAASTGEGGNDAEPSSLEQAAIEAGVIPDIRNVTLSGAYERQSSRTSENSCVHGHWVTQIET